MLRHFLVQQILEILVQLFEANTQIWQGLPLLSPLIGNVGPKRIALRSPLVQLLFFNLIYI